MHGKRSVESLLKRAEKAFSDRDNNRTLFEDCYELLSPYRNTLTKTGGTLNKPTRQYDSTGQISAANFVNTLQTNFTPVFTRWALLTAGPGIPEEKRQTLNETLEAITEQVFAYINSSNFATAVAEMFFEWGMGTGCLWCLEGDEENPLNFIATPISQMGLSEGRFGTVDAKFRKYNLKGGLIEHTWKNVKLSDKLRALIESDKEKEFEVLECFTYDYESLSWRYCVVVEKEEIHEAEFAEEICFTPRWMKIPGFAYGVGPFVMALADIKTLNVLKEFQLRSAALDVGGVYTVTSDSALNINNVNIQPLTFIPVERNAGENGPSISRLDTGGNYQLQEFLATGLQDQIRKTLLDNKLPAETPQPKTAFEIAQRMKEFQVDIGSAYGRAMFEFVIPLFKRIIGILSRRGLLQIPPGFTIDTLFIKVQVTSPIATVQNMEDVQRFMQSFQMAQAINPTLALTAYEVEKIPAWVNEMVGAPAKLLRSEAEASQMQQMIAQYAAQLQAQGNQQ